MLRTAAVRHPYRGVFVPRALTDSLDVRCAAALLVLPARAVFSFGTAAAVYRAPLPRWPDPRLEVTVPAGTVAPQSRGLIAHVARLDPSRDVRIVDRLPVTAPARTVLDLAARLRLVELVVVADHLLVAGLLSVTELADEIDRSGRRRGVVRAREALSLVDGRSRSPMETRVRLILVEGGLPRPESNADVFDRSGGWIATVDLLYRDLRIVIEYDGRDHADEARRVRDLTRRNLLVREGYYVLHYSARDVYVSPHRIVDDVRAAFAARSAA